MSAWRAARHGLIAESVALPSHTCEHIGVSVKQRRSGTPPLTDISARESCAVIVNRREFEADLENIHGCAWRTMRSRDPAL